MQLEIAGIPKVEAPKISATLPTFTTTNTVSIGSSGFSTPSNGNLINVSSLASNGIKTSIAPPLDFKSVTPSLNLNGKVNVAADTLKAMTTKAGITATIGTIASGMNIPIGLPSTTDALKTLGVPTDLASLQKALDFKLPEIPAFPGINFALLFGKSPQFIAEVVLKYKTICLPHIPGVKINMAQALAAISIIKAVASGQGGAIIKHLLEGITGELKAELIQGLEKSISAGLNESANSLQSVLKESIKLDISVKAKNQKDEYDEDGELIPRDEIEPDFDLEDYDTTQMQEESSPNSTLQDSNNKNIGQFSDNPESPAPNNIPTEQTVATSPIAEAVDTPVAKSDTNATVKTQTAPVTPSPAQTPNPGEQFGLSLENYNKLNKYTRQTKQRNLQSKGSSYNPNTASDPKRLPYVNSANSLDKYNWIYPFEEKWDQGKIDAWSKLDDPVIW